MQNKSIIAKPPGRGARGRAVEAREATGSPRAGRVAAAAMLRLALVPRVQGSAGHALAGSPERLGVLFGCAVLSRKWSCENSGQLDLLFQARGVARKMPRRRAARVAPLRRRFPMMAASPPSRVTLADFRAMQALLLDTRQQLEDSRDRERKAREELRERPTLPDPASFPPPPPFNPLNPFGPAAGRVTVEMQTDPSSLELELHDELRRMRDTLQRTREELQASREELRDARVRASPRLVS